MDWPPSTQLLVNAGGKEPTPTDFIQYIQSLIETGPLASPPSVHLQEGHAMTPQYIDVVASLSDDFLSKFPRKGSGITPDRLQAATDLCILSLEVLERVIVRVEGLFGQDGHNLHCMLICRLLACASRLDEWLEDSTSPQLSALWKRVFDVVAVIFKTLGGDLMLGKTRSLAAWTAARACFIECIGALKDILPPSPLTLPLRMNLFRTPRVEVYKGDAFGSEAETQPVDFDLKTAMQRASHILNLQRTLIFCLSLRLQSEAFMVDLARETLTVTCQIFDFFISSPQLFPTKTNASIAEIGIILRLLQDIRPLLSGSAPLDCASLLAPYLSRLLALRLKQGPKAELDGIDHALLTCFEACHDETRVFPEISDISQILREETWGEVGISLRTAGYAYVSRSLREHNAASLTSMQADLASLQAFEPLDALRKAIDARIAALDGLDTGPGPRGRKRKRRPDDVWRKRIEDDILDVLYSQSGISRMAGVELTEDASWPQHVLRQVENCFASPIVTAIARVHMAQALTKLPCCLAEHEMNDCKSDTPPRYKLLPVYVAAMGQLISGTNEDITAEVRRHAYEALAYACRHHILSPSDVLDDSVRPVERLLRSGMERPERAVRLSAGRALAEYVRLHHNDSSGPTLPAPFSILHSLSFRGRPQVRETTIVTMGLVGRLAPHIIKEIVCELVLHFGQQSGILKAVTYQQLTALATHYDKGAYTLLSPYLPDIALSAASVYHSKPSLLVETCQFMSISPADFLNITAIYTIPHLVSICHRDALTAIANELGKNIASVILLKPAEVFECVYMLQGETATNRALDFILDTFRDATPPNAREEIRLEGVVSTQLNTVLARLTMELGGEDPDRIELARAALLKVEKTVTPIHLVRQRGAQSDLPTFLRPYLLGIVTHITDFLQDYHGKQIPKAKQQAIRSFGQLVGVAGPGLSSVAPQIVTVLQSTLNVGDLAEATLNSWYAFITGLPLEDIGQYVGLTTASIVSAWPKVSGRCHDWAQRLVEYLVLERGAELGPFLDEVVALDGIPALAKSYARLLVLRQTSPNIGRLRKLLERSGNENPTVAVQALSELRKFMTSSEGSHFVQGLASGDSFDPEISGIIKSLFAAACREGDLSDRIRLLAFECLGILGAVDPDRFDVPGETKTMIVLHNFKDEDEAFTFVIGMIEDHLVGVFRSTGDIRFQGQLAYVLQEMLRFCGFTPALTIRGSSVPSKIRKRWDALPKHVVETVAPLLEGKFTYDGRGQQSTEPPIYPTTATYREWLQRWTSYLIDYASGERASSIFRPFLAVTKSEDVAVIRHLLPHLVLNILISGEDKAREAIHGEIIAVLADEADSSIIPRPDRKLLSSQTAFALIDHLSKWIRLMRLDITKKRQETKRSRIPVNLVAQDQLVQVESLISSINHNLMATAALECKQYARALIGFEQQVIDRQARHTPEEELQTSYERLHEIYAHLDEPDGMEGITSKVLSPSLEHQIREHESTGRWTSAQSCWEVSLQQSPNDLNLHLGLLRCLRNLGHYDTLRTHIRGMLSGHPDWETPLAGFSAEGAWMVGDWQGAEELVQRTKSAAPEIAVARLLLAMRNQDAVIIEEAMAAARMELGQHITAAGPYSYRRSYDAVVDLHRIRELEMICDVSKLHEDPQTLTLNRPLTLRLDATLPTYRAREPILSMRRTSFGLKAMGQPQLVREIGKSWLSSSKIARKAGYNQTAYGAMLQARQSGAPYYFIQGCKLVKSAGDPLRALQELDNALQFNKPTQNTSPIHDQGASPELKLRAKGYVLKARWMAEADRYEYNNISLQFTEAVKVCETWESAYVHWGQFVDQALGQLPTVERGGTLGIGYTAQVVRNYLKALASGSKYIYQTLPRMLTLWLDLGEHKELVGADGRGRTFTTDPLKYLQQVVSELNKDMINALAKVPVYKWLTAFPQIVSRVDHPHLSMWKVIMRMVLLSVRHYPQQSLWIFAGVMNSTRNKEREKRVQQLLQYVRGKTAKEPASKVIDDSRALTSELLRMCNYPLGDDTNISMAHIFPTLKHLAPLNIILPLQSSFFMILPPTSSLDDTHRPFPDDLPTIKGFIDEVEVMRSLQKPRKFGIKASDGETYYFLAKPKDDLRKDARLMDLNGVINKLLKKHSESRRRQLHIRTYSVVPINEECGLIEWVRGTVAFRVIIGKYWEARGIALWPKAVSEIYERMKGAAPEVAAETFVKKVLPFYPTVFREWFLETFPEPTAWLASRLAFGRTAAVMSMVGYILGLGDRHCENIMFDCVTGDTVHCDFNCLFDKGKTFEIPELVPFRLTQNIVDALGLTGVEGVFRLACESTMQLLRDNKDCLMSVLEAFVHDPLVEWEDEKRRKERRNTATVDLRDLARNSLDPIHRKLGGIEGNRQISVSNQVDALIRAATDPKYLGKMYQGWCAFC